MPRYMISMQGNRNLAFGRDENIFFDDLADAKKEARRKTQEGREAWNVFEVSAKLMYVFRPTIKEEDWSGASE